jgi:phosphatidylinositol glycan class U
MHTSMDRKALLLFGAAAGVRFLLFTAFPSLPDTLTGRVEISTPVTSFKRRENFPKLPHFRF